ncbi:hypothetical protein O6H91_05G070000 [Diphasiastrum complanatum]|uniref:Uncharacterized protein n=1 Tax=Diphasiastrum complanatum TaxID=34168 RepID=A0ACC2DQ48_DIPCM|nr:hypothetical protein O6H91_05G070000 [Diphasiastrum complanatum]
MQSNGRSSEFGGVGGCGGAEIVRSEGDDGNSRALVVVRGGSLNSSGGGGGRGRRPRALALSPGLYVAPSCKVDGCVDDLSSAGEYHRRHRVCKAHASASKVVVDGQEQRFCQQCSRFHSLVEFDEGKRSCRKRLAGHNERRRRQQPADPLATTSSGSHVPLLEGIGSLKRARVGNEWKGSGRLGARGRGSKGLSFKVVLEKQERPTRVVEISKGECYLLQRPTKSGEESSSVLSDPMEEHVSRGDTVRCKEKARDLLGMTSLDQSHLQVGVGVKKNRNYMEQGPSGLKEGLELGDGLVLPPLPIKRDGAISFLKKWPHGMEDRLHIGRLEEPKRYSLTEFADKKAWQKEDDAAFLHCLWECPKVQPVWRWAGRQLSKIRGSKVTLEWKQAVFGDKLGAWASSDIVSVWKLLRGIILGQIWHARKGKVYSGLQWSSGQVIRGTWVDLMMYAMKDWLEVLKAKGSVQHAEAHELWARFDSKWLINRFAGRRTEWSMSWKDPNEVLLD